MCFSSLSCVRVKLSLDSNYLLASSVVKVKCHVENVTIAHYCDLQQDYKSGVFNDNHSLL